MGLIFRAEPRGGRDVVHEALRRRKHRAEVLPALRGVLQTGVPLPIYVLSGKEISRSNPLTAARLVGWQYPIRGGLAAGLVCLRSEADGLKFGGLRHGGLAERFFAA